MRTGSKLEQFSAKWAVGNSVCSRSIAINLENAKNQDAFGTNVLNCYEMRARNVISDSEFIKILFTTSEKAVNVLNLLGVSSNILCMVLTVFAQTKRLKIRNFSDKKTSSRNLKFAIKWEFLILQNTSQRSGNEGNR